MNEKNHQHSPVGALILITIGALFLLNNIGILPFSVWFVLWRFWPVLLILAGIRLILGRGKNHEAFATISFLIVIIVLLISIASVNPSMRSWMQSHMPWFPMNQMMPNNNNNFWNNMPNRRYRMYFNNGNNSNDFNSQDFNNY